MKEIRNSILAGLVFGFLSGLLFSVAIDIEYGLIAGLIGGLLFGMGLYFFVTSRVVNKRTRIGNINGRDIIYSGGANHLVNAEAVGGKLYLLTDRLLFQSHGFNIQNQGKIIDLNRIKEVRFYNTLGIVPNGLAITTLEGDIAKFVVNDRRIWKRKIERVLNQ